MVSGASLSRINDLAGSNSLLGGSSSGGASDFSSILGATINPATGLPASSQNTSAYTVQKPRLSGRNFLLGKFMGKTLPILDSSGQITGVGTVTNIVKDNDKFVFTLQSANDKDPIKAVGVFAKDTLGENYKRYQDDPNKALSQNMDMEQRLNAGIGPLLDHSPSESTSSSTPQSFAQAQVIDDGPGETFLYQDPAQTDLQKGTMVIYKGKAYSKEDGSPLTLHLERLQE